MRANTTRQSKTAALLLVVDCLPGILPAKILRLGKRFDIE
jgi:hypothetical protein